VNGWSPLRALTWEYARLARAQVFSVAVASCSLAALFRYALAGLGDERDRLSFVGLVTMLMIFNITTLMNCREGGLGLSFERRLYRLPLPTWKLVAGRMLPALIAATIMALTVGGFMRFGLGAWWPMLAPWLLTLACAAWLLALGWALGHSRLLFIPAVVLSFAPAGIWLQPRLQAEQPMAHLAAADAATLLVVVVAAFGIAVLGVGRDRAERGGAGVISAARRRVLAGRDAEAATMSARQQADAGAVLASIGSPLWAQTWMEWREKGWMLPALVGGGLATNAALGLIMQIGTDRALQSLLVYPFVGVLLVPPVVGFMFGRFDMSSEAAGIDPFRARRPLGDRQLAWTFLAAGAFTVVVTWGVGVVGIGLALVGLRFIGDAALVDAALAGVVGAFFSLPPTTIGYLVLTLFGVAWTAMGVTLSITLTGRNWVAAGPYGLVLLAAAADRIFGVDILAPSLPWVVAGLVVVAPLVTVAIAVTAVRRGLLSGWFVVGIFAAWIADAAFFGEHLPGIVEALTVVEMGGTERFVTLALPAALAFPVLPIVLAPLALWWNRHR